MYLNVYVPHLQTVGAMVGYLRVHRGQRFASTTAVAPMTEAFVRNIEQFVDAEGIDLVAFEKGQRKDDVTQKYLRSSARARACSSSARRRRRRRSSAPSGAAAGTGRNLSVDRAIHGDGQPLLLLLRRRGLRPVLPEVLLLLPLQRQALHQRPRVRQAPACQARDRLRGAGQRHPVLRRPQAAAAALRWAVGGQDRSAAAQVAAPTAASVSRHAIAPPAIATSCRSCRPSSR